MTQIWLTPVGVRDEVSDTVLAKAKATVDLTNQHWLSYRQARVSGLCRNKRWIQRGWGSSFCLREFKRWCNRVWKEVQGGVVWHLFPVYVALPVLPKLLNSCPVGSDPEAQLRMPDVRRICLRCAAICAAHCRAGTGVLSWHASEFERAGRLITWCFPLCTALAEDLCWVILRNISNIFIVEWLRLLDLQWE